LIPSRLASGRGATEQPNATGDREATLSPMFWGMLLATGVASGLFGDAMMALLHAVQHLAFGARPGGFLAAVSHAPAWRRVAALAAAGAFAGPAWYLLRRATRGERSEVDDVLWNGTGELSFRRSLGSGVFSEVVIGAGASIGRENAPKLLGAAAGSVLARWSKLTPPQRRLLVACGAGSGFAAVYNVPLGGALFTAEVLLGTITLPVVVPALACAGIATLVGWIYLPHHAIYLDIPSYPLTGSALVWAALAGPVIGLVAVGYIRLIGAVAHHRPTGKKAALSPLVAFTALGAVGIAYPQLFGNGKDITHLAFLGTAGGIGLVATLFALKPLATAACLGSGATGGLFTPTMATGALLGVALGAAFSLAWPGTPAGAYAMIAAVAMIGAGMQAPLAGLALILGLTHSGFDLIVPMLIATALATLTARYLDGYSIYSARLPAE
jgi:H+/Cl- antiporter ClcA